MAIFILPPSGRELKKRLLDRKTDSLETIRVRLKNAEKELQAVKHFDYAVINAEIVLSVEAVETIMKAARYRVRP